MWLTFTEVLAESHTALLSYSFSLAVGLESELHSPVPMTLRIFAITRPGLVALALAVAALWICVGAETAARRQANQDTVASIRTLARLRGHAEGPVRSAPARAPMPLMRVQRPAAS